MDEKRKEDEVLELTAEEIDEIIFQEQIASGEYNEEVPEYYFSNPDPYAKVEPRPDDAPKRNFSFDENGNIVVKNPSAFWLPEVKIVDEIGGTEYTISGVVDTNFDLSRYDKLLESADVIGRSNLIIDDTPGINVSELRSKCRKFKLEHGLDLVIIDYLQLMSGSGRGNMGGYCRQQLDCFRR